MVDRSRTRRLTIATLTLPSPGAANSLGANKNISIDTTAPTITITDPNTSPAQSKTIAASASDGTLTMSNTTHSICDGSLTFVAYASQTFTHESDNGTKVCYQVVDTAGNTAYNLSNAIAGIDITAPTVSSTTPADSASGVALNSAATINWSEEVDCATVTTSAVTISTGGWTLTSCSGSQAVFTPSGQADGTQYTITVGTGVTDLAGNPIASNYQFSYWTPRTFTSTTDGLWNAVAWSPNGVPTPNDSVIIATAVTLDENKATTASVTVNSGGTLNCGTNIINGPGAFTLASGATLGIGSPDGISSSGANGNIRTDTRHFDTGANYVYNGSEEQVTGDGLPGTVNNLTTRSNFSINRVTLAKDVTVNGVLSLAKVDLIILEDNHLTLASNAAGIVAEDVATIKGTGTVVLKSTKTIKGAKLVFAPEVQLNVGDPTAGTLVIDANTTVVVPKANVNGSLIIHSGATLQVDDTLKAKGDIANSGTQNGTGKILLTGGSGHILTGSGGYENLELDDALDATLGSDVKVNGKLKLTHGLLKVKSHDLILGASASVEGITSASNMVVTDEDGTQTGKLCKEYSGAGSFEYPVGDARGTTVDYSPATLNFTGGSFTPGQGLCPGHQRQTPQHAGKRLSPRYWTASTDITGFNCATEFKYVDGDVVGTESSLSGAKWNGSAWTVFGGVDTGTHSFAATVSSFSDFSAGAAGPSPLTWRPSPRKRGPAA